MRSLTSPRPKRNPDAIEVLVVDALRTSGTPLSAYQLSDVLASSGHKLSASQAYRTLARLMDRDIVQRIETLSAYVAKDEESDIVLICGRCHAVQRLKQPGLKAHLGNIAASHAFAIDAFVLEVTGHCTTCRDSLPSSPIE